MATATNQPVTAENLLSATVKYSNKDDSARVYDISANVKIRNGEAVNFENGEVKRLPASADSMDSADIVATFHSYSKKSLNYDVNNASEEESKLILESVYTFMADVKANVNANPINA